MEFGPYGILLLSEKQQGTYFGYKAHWHISLVMKCKCILMLLPSMKCFHHKSITWVAAHGRSALSFLLLSLLPLSSASACGRRAEGPPALMSFQMESHQLGMCVHFVRLISNLVGGMGSVRISRQTDKQRGGLSGSLDSMGSQQTLCTHLHGPEGRAEEAVDVWKHTHTHTPIYRHSHININMYSQP